MRLFSSTMEGRCRVRLCSRLVRATHLSDPSFGHRINPKEEMWHTSLQNHASESKTLRVWTPARLIASIHVKMKNRSSSSNRSSISIRWNALIAAHVCRFAPFRPIFALDDLPKKWEHYAK